MNRRNLVCIVWIVLGAVLFGCGIAEVVDEFWCGVGGGFLGVGIFRIVRIVRYRKDETYREAVDTAKTDERNRFLANKAWAWAGYLYVIVGALLSGIGKSENRVLYCDECKGGRHRCNSSDRIVTGI